MNESLLALRSKRLAMRCFRGTVIYLSVYDISITGSFRLLIFAVRRAWNFPLDEFEIEDEDRIDHRNQQQSDKGRAEHSAHLCVTHRLPQRAAAKGQWDKGNH